jgi:hypothetical protein
MALERYAKRPETTARSACKPLCSLLPSISSILGTHATGHVTLDTLVDTGASDAQRGRQGTILHANALMYMKKSLCRLT